ncbi:calcium-binding protein [Rhizorhabdus argentea]|uniref:calcium-binding protein n=1 Tax=Rhizorhabdus argentea TaxID=1387174 RepID=UPI0030EDCECE
MAQVVSAGDYAFRMDELDLQDLTSGTYLSRSSTGFALDAGDGYTTEFRGFDLSYDAFGDPLTGTITGITNSLDGQANFEITQIDATVGEFAHWAFDLSAQDGFAALLAGNDSFYGSDFDDYMQGFAGHDDLYGGDGSDTLAGGSGNDHIYGQSPYGGPDGNDVIYGGSGSDYIQGNAGDDSLDGGTGSDRIVGGQGNDVIVGGDGNDSINGNRGDDIIYGGADHDTLRGGQGDDSISGGDGDDLISGDLGTDTLRGGNGSDLFVVSGLGSTISNGPDLIVDFGNGRDVIGLDFTPTALVSGTAQTFFSAATAAQQMFDAHAGGNEVAALGVGEDTYIFYSSSGGATVDSAIELAGVSASEISVYDFI